MKQWYLTHLVLSWEEWLSGVHLDQDAAEGPGVDGGVVVPNAEQDFGRTVEPRLDVLETLQHTKTSSVMLKNQQPYVTATPYLFE